MTPSNEDSVALRPRAETLAASLPGAPRAADVQTLAGDASTRAYFRLALEYAPGTSGPATVLLMQFDRHQTDAALDWLEIQRTLATLQLPVPEVYGGDPQAGLLCLQDLGDVTLGTRLAGADDRESNLWYDRAVDLLADMQSRVVEPEGPAFARRFDVEKLMWEFDFMLEHYVEGLLELKLSAAARQAVRHEMQKICEDLAALETCFAHRDYHSRNLMVWGDQLVMIDFQDARLGPPQYDLVSLLRDSYVTLPENLVADKKERFLKRKENLEGHRIDREAFDAGFDLMSVQRNLKAVGTFAYQARARGNRRYLPHIAPTLDYVRATLKRRPEMRTLGAALEEALPPLRPETTRS